MRRTIIAFGLVPLLAVSCTGGELDSLAELSIPACSSSNSSPPVAKPAVADDFNGDGLADVVLHQTGGDEAGRGLIHVVLTGADAKPECELVLPPQLGAYGWHVGSGDFNADGYADLVAPIPFSLKARVLVLPGGPNGPQSHKTFTIFGPEDPENFGSSIAVADFNDDGYLDLAIGSPSGNVPHRAFIRVYWGSVDGLSGSNGYTIRDRKDSDFGQSLAAGDINGDGHTDLVTSWSQAIEKPRPTPKLLVMLGSASGPHHPKVVARTPGEVAPVVGDLTGDGIDDVVTTDTCQRHGAGRAVCKRRGGQLLLYRGSKQGLRSKPTVIRPGLGGVPGRSRRRDGFGIHDAVIPGRSGQPGTLMVSSQERVDGHALVGALYVLPGSISGIAHTGARRLEPSSRAFGLKPDDVQWFSQQFTVRDLNGGAGPYVVAIVTRHEGRHTASTAWRLSGIGTSTLTAVPWLALAEPYFEL